jgi:hypothetical protein
MTSVRIGRPARHKRAVPSWWAVVKSTARVHRSDALILTATAAFVVVFALAGVLLARNGSAV